MGQKRIGHALSLALACGALMGCTQVYTTPPGGGPLALAATYTTLPGVGTVPFPRPPPSGPYGHDGVYAGAAQALNTAGLRCTEFGHARDFRVSGRAVTFGPFRGTIGEEGGLQMIYGQNTVVGHFEGNQFLGVIDYQVPPCTYAMRLVR